MEKLESVRSGRVQKSLGLQIKLRLSETKQLALDLEETDEKGTRIQSIILHHYTQAIFFLRLNNLTSYGVSLFPTPIAI